MNPSISDPQTVFNVRVEQWSATTIEFSQFLAGNAVDHRGYHGIASLGVLTDMTCGAKYFQSQPQGSVTIQARLSISLGEHLRSGEILTSAARLLHGSAASGISNGDLATATGTIVGTATARSVRVNRQASIQPAEETQTTAEPTNLPTGSLPADGPTPQSVGILTSDVGPRPASQLEELKLPVDPHIFHTDGKELIGAMLNSELSLGPLAQLLNISLDAAVQESKYASTLNFSVVTQPWMANYISTMHGGIIASIGACCANIHGQWFAEAGQDYLLAEYSTAFYRSPAIDSTKPIEITTRTIKAGRRIVALEIDMTQDNSLVSRATADIQLTQ